MADCIFCKISNKQIPSQVVYEDSDVLAFKDISPASEGHTLVITKTHFADIFDVAPDLLRKSIETAQQIAQKMKTEQKIESVNLLNCSGKYAGQSVYHFHMHIIPRREGDAQAVVPKLDFLSTPKI